MGVPLVMEPNFVDYSCQVKPQDLFYSSTHFHIDCPAIDPTELEYGSLNSVSSPHSLKMMPLSKNPAWKSALTPLDGGKSPETLTSRNVPRHERLQHSLCYRWHHNTRFERNGHCHNQLFVQIFLYVQKSAVNNNESDTTIDP